MTSNFVGFKCGGLLVDWNPKSLCGDRGWGSQPLLKTTAAASIQQFNILLLVPVKGFIGPRPHMLSSILTSLRYVILSYGPPPFPLLTPVPNGTHFRILSVPPLPWLPLRKESMKYLAFSIWFSLTGISSSSIHFPG